MVVPTDSDHEQRAATFRHVGSPVAAELRGLRRRFGAWLADRSFPPALGDDAVLAFSELFTNALEAGARVVEFSAATEGEALVLEMLDDGPEWEVPELEPHLPGPGAARGRGLAILARLGTLEIGRTGGCTRVTLRLGPR